MEWCCGTSEAAHATHVEHCSDVEPRWGTETDAADFTRSHSGVARSNTISTVVHSHPSSTSRSLELTFPDETLRRGCTLPYLLRGFGRHLISSQVAEEEKAKLLRDSRVVPRLDAFVSHSWRDSGTPKFLCILLYCNGPPAVVFSVAVSVVACVLVIMGVLPLWVDDYPYAPWPTFVGCPVFYLMLFFLHHAPGWLGGGRDARYFLDKLCIDQCDPARKNAGIAGLAAFIAASDRLLLMWSPTYFTRLWCTVELATFLRLLQRSPGSLSERSLSESLVFRPLQLTMLTVYIMVFAQLSVLLIGPRAFLKDRPQVGEIVWLIIPTLGPLMLCLGVVHRIRTFTRDREHLDAQLAHFRIEGADCFAAEDREVIYLTTQDFHGSLDAFNQVIRGRFREVVLTRIPGRNGLPPNVLVFMLLPFVFNALDWTAHNVLAYSDWRMKASRSVYAFSAVPSVWLTTDVICRVVNTRRVRGMWQSRAARNMMLSIVITVPVGAAFGAHSLVSWSLKRRHPLLGGTHFFLLCCALVIARVFPFANRH